MTSATTQRGGATKPCEELRSHPSSKWGAGRQRVWGLGGVRGEALLCPGGVAASGAEPGHRSGVQGMLLGRFLNLR